MMYSFRIEQGIRAAAVLHKDMVRKGRAPYPYSTHLFAVSCLVADYSQDEDTIIAALLHDALDYTDYTSVELEKDFGVRVRTIVESLSVAPYRDEPREVARTHFLDTVRTMDEETLIVLVCDTIHNMRSVIEEYNGKVSEYLADFGGDIGERIIFYETLSNTLNRQLQSQCLFEFNHVYTEYKKFLEYGARN